MLSMRPRWRRISITGTDAAMPTCEQWMNEDILAIRWESPLTASELSVCFNSLARMIGERTQTVQVLFDIRAASSIPVQAPLLAVRSGFLSKPNTGKVVVVSTDVIAEILANVATNVTRHPIVFFPCYEAALEFLRAAQLAAQSLLPG